MRIVDTHSHIYLEEFDSDRPQVVQRALEAGVEKIILPAIDLPTLYRVDAMCHDYPGVCYPLIGLHPTELGTDYAQVLQQMKNRLDNADGFYIGIGEIGLDLYWDTTYRKEQLAAFDIQLQWALEKHLPVVIHARSAHRELVEVVSHYKDEPLRGIFHCFSGTQDECQELLQFSGFLLGIGGVLTYKKSTLPAVIKDVPLERIVLETDSPYLSPVPHRGKRNESAFTYDTLCYLAKIKELPVEQVAQITTRNAENLFWPV